MKRVFTVFLVVAFFCVGIVYAETKSPGINKRQVNQQKRIADGIKSGELTKKEVRKLERGQARIQRTKKEMKADGELTKEEREQLKKMQDVQSARIYKEKHDAQQRGDGVAPGVSERQVNQSARIKEGIKSGELTKDEAKELIEGQKEIKEERKEMKQDDGVLDKDERKELHQDLNEASKNIYEEKHDEEKR